MKSVKEPSTSSQVLPYDPDRLVSKSLGHPVLVLDHHPPGLCNSRYKLFLHRSIDLLRITLSQSGKFSAAKENLLLSNDPKISFEQK